MKKNNNNLVVEAKALTGKWRLEGTKEYWRLDSGFSGETWDESDDVSEGEGSRLRWTVEGPVLKITLVGDMGQKVPYDYTILAQPSSTLTIQDAYENVKTFRKI